MRRGSTVNEIISADISELTIFETYRCLNRRMDFYHLTYQDRNYVRFLRIPRVLKDQKKQFYFNKLQKYCLLTKENRRQEVEP